MTKNSQIQQTNKKIELLSEKLKDLEAEQEKLVEMNEKMMAENEMMKKENKMMKEELLNIKSKIMKENTKEENEKMKEVNENMKEELLNIKSSVNDREQYARSWSIRINGLWVSKEEEDKYGKDHAAMKKAWDRVVKPILIKAKENNKITNVPDDYLSVLENGHKLTTKSQDENKPAPLIIRFSSRVFRNTVLRNRKDNIPKPTTAEIAAGIKYFSMSEDLTRPTYTLLKNMKADKRIEKVWTIDGKLRFTKTGDQTKSIKMVNNSLLSIDKILHME
jgi:hypothetical protein